jgi:HEAT repeat protein
VYQHAAAVLVDGWDRDRRLFDAQGGVQLDSRAKIELLGRLAWRMQCGSQGHPRHTLDADVVLKEVEEYLVGSRGDTPSSARDHADRLLGQLRERSFVFAQIGHDGYDFVHRAFHEYFCAEDLRRRLESDPDRLLAGEEFRKYCLDETWQEILLLTANMIDVALLADYIAAVLEARDPCQMLIDGKPSHNLSLAARILADCQHSRQVDVPAQSVLAIVTRLLATSSWRRSEWEPHLTAHGDEIFEFLDTSVLSHLQSADPTWLGGMRYVRWFIAAAPYLVPREQWRRNRGARLAALLAVALGKDYPPLRHRLFCLGRHGAHFDLRQAAIEAVSTAWADDVTRYWLIDCAEVDEWDVRLAAVRALGRWREDPEVIAVLEEREKYDRDEEVRSAAAEALTVIHLAGQHQPVRAEAVANRSQVEAAGRTEGPDAVAWSDQVEPAWRASSWKAVTKGWKSQSISASLSLESLTDRLDDPDAYVRRAAIEALVLDWGSHAETRTVLRRLAMKDRNSLVRAMAVRAVAECSVTPDEAALWLREHAKNDRDPKVRQTAIEALAHKLPGRATADLLWNCALPRSSANACHLAINGSKVEIEVSERETEVRETAMKELCNSWADHPEALDRLGVCVLEEPSDPIRCAAVRTLASGWSEHPDTVRLLRDLAAGTLPDPVLCTVMTVLAGGWPDEETGEILRKLAEGGQSTVVRSVAIQLLAVGWSDHDMVDHLRRYAGGAGEIEVRVASIEALAAACPGSGSLEFLLGLARNSGDICVRRTAMEALAAAWPDSEVLDVLCRLAADTGDSDARRAAIEALFNGWADFPEVWTLIRKCSTDDSEENIRRFAGQLLRSYVPSPRITAERSVCPS